MEDNKEPQEPTGSEIRSTSILEAFAKRYSPAYDIQSADTFLSTHEIYNEVISHCPDPMITEVMVYQLLTEMDFRYDVIQGSAKYVWLLKSRI